MNAGYVVIQKIVTLFQSEVHTDAPDAFSIIFASSYSAQELGGKACASGKFGDTSDSAHGRDRHDASDNRHMDVGQCATLAKVKEIAIFEK